MNGIRFDERVRGCVSAGFATCVIGGFHGLIAIVTAFTDFAITDDVAFVCGLAAVADAGLISLVGVHSVPSFCEVLNRSRSSSNGQMPGINNPNTKLSAG